MKLDCGYRRDLLISSKVVVEVKSIRAFEALLEAQLLTYLGVGG